MREEKLVVEVIAAHNLMPKDGLGSSSPYVQVEFEGQKLRTKSKPKDLNPIWNEKLIFEIPDLENLPYKCIDIAVYNEQDAVTAGRNFLGKATVFASAVPAPNEEVSPQLLCLEKRSMFSHIRGELSLKIYRINCEATDVKVIVSGNNNVNSKTNNPGKTNKTKEKQKNNSNNTSKTAVAPNDSKVVGPTGGGNNRQQQVAVGPATKSPELQLPKLTPFPAPMAASGCDFSLKETRPNLGGDHIHKDKTSSTYNLVEQMQYLYVKVARARDLITSSETHVEVKLGNYRGVTRSSSSHSYDQVFAFSKDNIQSSTVEVFLKDKDGSDFIGRVGFDLNEVPKRVPPDSPLAPQWYFVEKKKGEKSKGEVMLSVWFGTQADESFSEAWHSKAVGVPTDVINTSLKSKVYMAPKLWYLRVSVIEAQDLNGVSVVGRFPDLFVKTQVSSQMLRTRPALMNPTRNPSNPIWNEDLMFVVAEPFDDVVTISVEDRIGPNQDVTLGRVAVPVNVIEKRVNDRPVVSKWFGLERNGSNSGTFSSKIHLKLFLDGGYHVLDEAAMYSSDLRPPTKELWTPHVGVLELGILGATGLVPLKIREGKGGSTDAYCVAKYGQKWIRTRTVIDSVCPKWNEQYTWEVFDPCTVITIGVFNNSCSMAPDARVGKVRIRLSTLEADRVYTHSYPLVVLHPSGVKKMGELHLAVRFSCFSTADMLHCYVRPLLPKMHYVDPLLVRQVENLRFQATKVVAARLARTEPPLGREVVEYMLDHGSHLWSMRKSKANFYRLLAVLSEPIAIGRWVDSIRSWQSPMLSVTSVLVYVMFVVLPKLILPTMLVSMMLIGLWRYRSRAKDPPYMDTRLSQADAVFSDELDEEFDTFPTSRNAEIVRMRYDRLRSVAGRVQTVLGDMATQAERVQSLLGWRDTRATFLFVVFCFVMAVVTFVLPLKVIVGAWGLYALRPPAFRTRMPSPFMNFFRRLPTRADSLL